MPFITSLAQRLEQIKLVDVPQRYNPKISLPVFHEEALRLYQVSIRYEKELCDAGVDRQIMLDIPGRVAASMEAQARWLVCQSTDTPVEKEWKILHKNGREFHDTLFHDLEYYLSNAGIDTFKEKFKSGYVSVTGLASNLSDFAGLIGKYSALLSSAGMDISRGEMATQYCYKLQEFYSSYKVESRHHQDVLKRLRNQALLYLTQAVSIVQSVAFHRFRNEPEIKREFTNEPRRKDREKKKGKTKEKSV